MNSKSFKILAAIVAMTFVFSALYGCQPTSTPNTQTGDKSVTIGNNNGSDKKTVLNVLWLAGMNQTNVIKQVLEEKFTKDYPDITVVFHEAPNTEINNKAMMEATSHTNTYDVVMQANTIPALANIGALEPLDPYIKRDNYPIEKFINNGIDYKGTYYGLPVRGDVRVLHYNQQHFIEAGLDPEKPPQSWEEFVDYAVKLTRNGHYGVNRAFSGSADDFVSMLYILGGDLLDKNNHPVFNNEIGLKAGNCLLSLLKDYKVVDPNATSWQYSDEIANYLSGAASMFDAWPARYIDAQNPEKSAIVGQSRVAPLFGKYSLVVGWYLVMFSSSKNKDAAWEFMKYVVDPKIQKEVILRGGDCNPTHIDVLNDPELNKKYEVLKAVRASFNKTKMYPQVTQLESVRQILDQYLGLAYNGSMTMKDALDQAAKEAEKVLREGGDIKD